MGLRKNEFAAVVQSNPDNCTVTIKRNGEGFYFVTLTVLTSKVEEELFTERGALKSWRDPAAAVQLVQELCPQCQFVMMEINGWVFARKTA
jgi:hypothetical protein